MENPLFGDQIRAAQAYEALHVPSLFRQWAPRVLDAIGVRRGDRLLDVACGTGVLAREALRRVGPTGVVAGLDAGRGMLTVARQLAPPMAWSQGSAEALPFPDHAFHAVVSQFGLMFFRDRPRALREMTRVLAPGGRLAVAVWDSLENSGAYPTEVDLLDRLAGSHAGDALRAPFVLGDRQALSSLFESAGVGPVKIETLPGVARFPSIRSLVEADLRGWLPVMGVALEESQIRRILAEAESALERYVTSEGDVVFDAPAHIVTGRRP